MSTEYRQNEIVEFVTHGKGKNKQRVGVMIARRHGDAVTFGWSRAAINRKDAFDHDEGLQMATDRLSLNVEVPPSMKVMAAGFRGRAARYFIDAPHLFTVKVMDYKKQSKQAPKPQRPHKTKEQWLKEKGIIE